MKLINKSIIAAVSIVFFATLPVFSQESENESPSDYIENSADEDEFYDASHDKESLLFITFGNMAYPRDFIVAAGEVLCENFAVSLFSSYPTINDADPYNDQYPLLPLADIGYNFTHPWGWDNSNFYKNQFLHPYCGSLYFIAGRSHDLNFAQSLLYTFAGSVLFEGCFQSRTPSLNDVLTTTFAGAVVGEMIHRVSYDIGDLLYPLSWVVSPVDAASTVVSGQRALRPAGYMDRLDVYVSGGRFTGLATFGSDTMAPEKTQLHFYGGGINIKYGEPYGHNSWEAFDQFTLKTNFHTNFNKYFASMFADGMFYSISLFDNSPFLTTAGITLNYDVIRTVDFAFSGSSLGGTYKMLLPVLNGGIGFEVEADYIFLGTMGDYYLMTENSTVTSSVSGLIDYFYCHGPQVKGAFTVYHPELFTINIYADGAFTMPYPYSSRDVKFLNKSLVGMARGEIEKEFGLGIYIGASFNCYYIHTLSKNIPSVTQFDTFTSAYVKYVF